MKFFILFISFFIFYSCGGLEQQPAATSKSGPGTDLPAEVDSHPNGEKEVKKSPVRTVRKGYENTSRAADQINKAYPYDIRLKTAHGEILNSADILQTKGKPTVLLFWLTTCGPCAREMEAISQVYETWQKETDFRLIAISTDFPKNHEAFVKRVEEKRWPWETYLDLNREFSKVMPGALNGLPQTFILDKNGKIAYHKRKYSTGDEQVLYEKVRGLVGG